MPTRRAIPTSELTLSTIPGPGAPWPDVGEFALSFNGYEHCGEQERCAEIANRRAPTDLAELRTCLFFEQRRYRHFGYEPTGDARIYILSLLERIRAAVINGDHLGGAE